MMAELELAPDWEDSSSQNERENVRCNRDICGKTMKGNGTR